MTIANRGRVLEIARVTIQFQSPFIVGRGSGDELRDTAPVVDANGLPTLPGTSLAGVLRHAWQAHAGDDAANRAFGFQKQSDGAASRVEVSFGQAHDASDTPVPFRAEVPLDDEVLELLRTGCLRDHVRIDGIGVVDGAGKFDVWMVPAGSRFTFEIVVHEGAGLGAADLVGLLNGPAVRLGGGTRRGLGRFSVVRASARRFDLADPADFDAFTRLRRALHEPAAVLEPLEYGELEPARFVTATLTLHPESWWMFGGGDPVREDHRRGDRVSDRVNAHEPRIRWDDDGCGRVISGEGEPDLLPATGLKGALRHRVAYHARRRSGVFAVPGAVRSGPELEPAVVELFGEVADDDEGRPGRLFLDDGVVDGDLAGWQQHVSLDRFTQGPVSGLLFDEAPRFGGKIRFELTVDTGSPADARALALGKRALADALDDLVHGRLAFGASASRGHGYARGGDITWSDDGAWLREER